ncbi:MAG: DUF2656 family protein [Cyanobacteria bacterium P01_D01_bin.105]
MTDKFDGRMLLSHNFTLTHDEVHPLSREEFAQVFVQGLGNHSGVQATLISHPHWVVDVSYETGRYTSAQVGQMCAEALATYRKQHNNEGFTVMALGGEKTTPATGAPPSLQTGEWGTDVVETADPGEFLAEINWDKLAGAKPSEQIFRIDVSI